MFQPSTHVIEELEYEVVAQKKNDNLFPEKI